MTPRQDGRRPLLPQHSRHCPVLEAGNSAGFLVYPPLEPTEAFHVECQGDGRYRFTFYMGQRAGQWQPIFAVTMTLPMGSVGKISEDVEFMRPDTPISPDAARQMMRMFIVPEDMGTPAGAITLRGATNFQTPVGWDTIYTPVFNNIERPVAPMLVVRVETDWYAHETEFRYVLQPGEGIPGAHNMPIGQVVFVPREAVVLRDCSEQELAALRDSQRAFAGDKAAATVQTPHGLAYSPHYARQSRARQSQDG
ncbi:MAG TPA: hypothetical protein VNJ02_20155 [Vicinamibacterales bacterium]|nr:hypothetical protein [Vicinamibacterales bacterium]